MNKVVNISLTGGIIGFFLDSPLQALRKTIDRGNAAGWRVVQIIPAGSHSLAYLIFRVFLLIITLLLFTVEPGYYVIFEKVGTDGVALSPKAFEPQCPKCKRNVKGDDAFCESCGTKLK